MSEQRRMPFEELRAALTAPRNATCIALGSFAAALDDAKAHLSARSVRRADVIVAYAKVAGGPRAETAVTREIELALTLLSPHAEGLAMQLGAAP
jgi:hypothetical protein